MVAAHPDALGIIDAGNAGMRAAAWAMCSLVLFGALLGQKMSPYDAAQWLCRAMVRQLTYWRRVLNARDAGNRSLSTLQRIVNPEVTDKTMMNRVIPP